MKFLEAVLILSGMIIGVGMFGIPFSFYRAGFWLGTFELIILTGVMTLIHLLYARIIIAVPSSHRLPGYVKICLGDKAEILAVFASFFGIAGSLLAYILVGSIFLHNIFQPFWAGSSEMLWASAIAVSGSLITLFGLKKEAFIDSILSAALLVLLGYIIFLLFPQVSRINFSPADIREAFLPYGVLLFALAGSAAIPDVVDLLEKKTKKISFAVILGTLIPAVVYFLFAFAVAGALGGSVSEEAIESMKSVLSSGTFLLLGLIGFLAIYDSYIILNANAQALLKLDFSFSRKSAWVLVSFIPFMLYVAGLHNFILIIGAVGAVAGGIEIGLLVASYHSLRRRQGIKFSRFSYFWKAAIFLLITAGVLYELYRGL